MDFSQMSDSDLTALAGGKQPQSNAPDLSSMSDDDLQKLASQPSKVQPSTQQTMDENATIAQSTNPIAAETGYGANLINQIPGLHELGSAEAAAIGVGKGDTFGDRYNNLEQAQQSMRDTGKKLYPTATTIGDVGANLATMGGLPTPEMKGLSALQKVGAGAATGAAYGSIYGAGNDVNAFAPTEQAEQQRLGNIKFGAEFGSALGAGTQGLVSGIGGIADSFMPSADRAALAQKAMDEHNIPIAVSQLTPADQGKFTKILASTASEVPFNQSGKFAQQQREAYNTAIAKTFGQDVSDNGGRITPDVIDAAYKDIGSKFDAAFKGKNIPISSETLSDIDNVIDNADQYSTAPNIVKNAATKLLSSIDDDGTISGEKLSNLRSLYGNIGKAQNDASPYVKQLRDIVINQVDDPVAREQYKNLRAIEPIAAKSADGYISPSLLNSKLISSRYFPDYTRGGGGNLGDLARIGNTFLKDTTPNSYTASRNRAYQLLYELPLGAAGFATGASPGAAAGIASAIPLARGVTGLNNSQGIARSLVEKALEGNNASIPETVNSMGNPGSPADAVTEKLKSLAGSSQPNTTGRAFKSGGGVNAKEPDSPVFDTRRTGGETGSGLRASPRTQRLSPDIPPYSHKTWTKLVQKYGKQAKVKMSQIMDESARERLLNTAARLKAKSS